MEINKQAISGNNNNQAGRDIIINQKMSKPLEFYEKDIKKVIIVFSSELKNVSDCFDELNRVDLPLKNQINNLSEDYFLIIIDEYMEYFGKIDMFFKDTINEEYLKMYKDTVSELKPKIAIHRKNYETFEEVFEVLYDYIFNKHEVEMKMSRSMIWVFLHYMYCKCHIGKKEKSE